MRPFISANKLLLQSLGVGHRGLGVGVLCLEMGADLGIEQSGIAHHLLPVLGAKPGVVVNPLDAVMQRDRGTVKGARPADGAAPSGTILRPCSRLGAAFVFGIELQRTAIDAVALAVGLGPSGKTWPRCASQLAQRTSVRRILGIVLMLVTAAAAVKLGQPVPESNLVSELNNGAPQQTQRYMPSRLSL